MGNRKRKICLKCHKKHSLEAFKDDKDVKYKFCKDCREETKKQSL